MDSTTLVLCYSALEMKLGWYGTRWYGTVWDGMGWYGTCFTALSQMQQITEIFWATQNKISRKVTNKRDQIQKAMKILSACDSEGKKESKAVTD